MTKRKRRRSNLYVIDCGVDPEGSCLHGAYCCNLIIPVTLAEARKMKENSGWKTIYKLVKVRS